MDELRACKALILAQQLRIQQLEAVLADRRCESSRCDTCHSECYVHCAHCTWRSCHLCAVHGVVACKQCNVGLCIECIAQCDNCGLACCNDCLDAHSCEQ